MVDAIPWLFLIPPALVGALGIGSLLYKRSAAGRAHRHLADGGRCLHRGNQEKAEDEFRAGLKLKPNHGALCGALASLLVSKEDYDEAFQLLQIAQEIHPRDMTLAVLLGRCQLARGRKGHAVKLLAGVPATDNAFLDANIVLADIAESDGDIALAVTFLEGGIQSASAARARPYNRDLRRLKALLEPSS